MSVFFGLVELQRDLGHIPADVDLPEKQHLPQVFHVQTKQCGNLFQDLLIGGLQSCILVIGILFKIWKINGCTLLYP